MQAVERNPLTETKKLDRMIGNSDRQKTFSISLSALAIITGAAATAVKVNPEELKEGIQWISFSIGLLSATVAYCYSTATSFYARLAEDEGYNVSRGLIRRVSVPEISNPISNP